MGDEWRNEHQLYGAFIEKSKLNRYAVNRGEKMNKKIGSLISNTRKEKGMTQSDLAHFMNISIKTISDWERGLSYPNVSLFDSLSRLLGVNIEELLSDGIHNNDMDRRKIKEVKFYSCSTCGNITTSKEPINIFCCGRVLEPLLSKTENDEHKLIVQETKDNYYVTFQHDMVKDHYITFVSFVSGDRFLLVKLYPEQKPALHFPKMSNATLYHNCNQHGLWKQEIKN